MKHATITDAALIGDANLKPAAKPRGRPIHKMLVSFSAAYFGGALVTDLAYWQAPDVVWERFSIWLIAAGLVMAGLAAIKSTGQPGPALLATYSPPRSRWSTPSFTAATATPQWCRQV